MRRFVVGDIHGAHRALRDVLTKAKFDSKEDYLICLGDLVDGWPESKQVVDLLLSLDHVTFIRGNHDQWFMDWIKTRSVIKNWYDQGGHATLESYKAGVPQTHRRFFAESKSYLELENMLFVHGGVDPTQSLLAQTDYNLMWNRELVYDAYHDYLLAKRHGLIQSNYGPWDRIYVGHTSTVSNRLGGGSMPLLLGNVMCVDTGAGWNGKLTMMNIDQEDEFYQSLPAGSFYPDAEGRGGR